MSWKRFQDSLLIRPEVGLSLDWSRMRVSGRFFASMEERMKGAFEAMGELESGAIANPDEERRVGHYWLRNPDMAPEGAMTLEIQECWSRINTFVSKIHSGEMGPRWGKSVGFTLQEADEREQSEREGKAVGEAGARFTDFLVIGIGGSALGPQFIANALGAGQADRMRPHFLDNTDPDGIDRVLSRLSDRFNETLVVVISKSGGTPETRNGMFEAKAAWEAEGYRFADHAVAITGEGSALERFAKEEKWLARFPMWDWVGGRTSVTSAVGLLPAALQGIDVVRFVRGAGRMDGITREPDPRRNPAAVLAQLWYHATSGKGRRDMVILPYKDRLELFSKYLQQLIMESLGKELDLDGKRVQQGIAVYGNKGSTDQHAYVQQLRDGLENFFVTFIEVLRDRKGDSIKVEGEATSGDFLQAFLLGTREALAEKGRRSLTITIPEITPESVGALIALYERAVGFYAQLVNINAYHQPGVEAGKKAAASILQLQTRLRKHLRDNPRKSFTASAMARALDVRKETETVYKLLQRLSANPGSGVVVAGDHEETAPAKLRFRAENSA